MKQIDSLEFTDDYMFGAVLRDEKLCKGVLELLLNIQVVRIEYPELQKSIKAGYESHGVRLDVYIKDSNTVYDIEMQNKNFKSIGKRTRFYQSMIDADFLLAGNDYENLKDSIILFICKNDPFNKGMQQYTFKSICCEDKNFTLNDNCKKVIYNASRYREEKNTTLRAFLHFIATNEATDDFTNALIAKVESIKKDEIFRTEYMKMNIAFMDATREVRFEEKIEIAKNLLAMKLPFEKISEATKLPLEQVMQLSNNKTV